MTEEVEFGIDIFSDISVPIEVIRVQIGENRSMKSKFLQMI